MTTFLVILIIILSLVFWLTGGAKAALAFWGVNAIIFSVILTIVGLDKLFTRRKGTTG